MIINLQQYRNQQRQKQLVSSFDTLFGLWIDTYMQYVVFPTMAAMITIYRRKLTVL